MQRVPFIGIAGTVESPSGQLQEISEEVKAWEDVSNSFGESSQSVDSQAPIHSSADDNLNTVRCGLTGDKLISLAGYTHLIIA